MKLEPYLLKNIIKKGYIFHRNKFKVYKRCDAVGIRFGITYRYDERHKDTVYYLHDFSREYRESVVGMFYHNNLDLLLDICSWLNWRDNDNNSSKR